MIEELQALHASQNYLDPTTGLMWMFNTDENSADLHFSHALSPITRKYNPVGSITLSESAMQDPLLVTVNVPGEMRNSEMGLVQFRCKTTRKAAEMLSNFIMDIGLWEKIHNENRALKKKQSEKKAKEYYESTRKIYENSKKRMEYPLFDYTDRVLNNDFNVFVSPAKTIGLAPLALIRAQKKLLEKVKENRELDPYEEDYWYRLRNALENAYRDNGMFIRNFKFDKQLIKKAAQTWNKKVPKTKKKNIKEKSNVHEFTAAADRLAKSLGGWSYNHGTATTGHDHNITMDTGEVPVAFEKNPFKRETVEWHGSVDEEFARKFNEEMDYWRQNSKKAKTKPARKRSFADKVRFR